MSKSKFAALIEKALAELPEPFDRILEEVTVEIRDRPTRRELRRVGLDEDHLLLGLYVGRSLLDRSVMDSGTLPDVIYIFQKDLEEICETEPDLVREVRKTVLHEIGHHFGMNEEDLDELGYG